MNKINDLIKELCPNGLKYYRLNELLDYIQPTRYIVKTTEYDDKYDIPVLTAGQTFILGYTNETKDIYEADINSPTIIFDDFTTSKHWVNFKFKVKSSAMKILVPKTKNSFRYIYYCMQNIRYSPKEHSRQWIQTYSNFKIPVPPIEIQEEIVTILDKFSELEAELESELEARKQQYNYYRNKLLCDNVYKKTNISKSFIRLRGTAITAGKMREINIKNGNIRIFAGGKTVIDTDELNIPEKDIIKVPSVIIQSRGIIDFIYYDKPFSFKQEMWAYTSNNAVTTKYLYYYLKNNVKYFRDMSSQMGSMPQIPLNVTENFTIYLPVLQEQQKIVKILDKFDKLINDISEGIPAEIALRKKQYEYYKNKLLRFKEVCNEQ